MKYSSALLVLTFSFLTACSSIHQDYTKPTVSIAKQWYAPLPHQGELSKLNDWWQQFDDAGLNTLLTAAQKNNPSMAIALANIKLSRANLSQVSGQLFPRLDGKAQSSKQKSGNAGGSGNIETKSINLDASWELDLFGKVAFSKKSAAAQLSAKEYDWHQARVSLAAEVATQYVQYRACQMTLDTRAQAATSQQETARITKISSDAGFSAPADAALASANAISSESLLIAQKTTCGLIVKSLTTLSQLTEPEVVAILAVEVGIPNPIGFSIESLPANLIKQRPDIIAKERTLAAASADIGVAKAALYPSITLNGSIGYQRTVFNDFKIKTNTWGFGPSINLPIFDGGQRRAQIRANKAAFKLALADYKQTIANAVQEVEQNLLQLDAANKRHNLESKSVQQFHAFFKASKINWESGGLDLLALEESRRQYINAQNSLITQKRDRVQYWIALYKAYGGDWQSQVEQIKGASN